MLQFASPNHHKIPITKTSTKNRKHSPNLLVLQEPNELRLLGRQEQQRPAAAAAARRPPNAVHVVGNAQRWRELHHQVDVRHVNSATGDILKTTTATTKTRTSE